MWVQSWMTRPQREGLVVLFLLWALAPQHFLSSWFFRKPNSLQCTPRGSITHSTGCGAKTGFPFLCLPDFSFNANSTFFGGPVHGH